MSTLLSDMMAMVWKRQKTKPKDKDMLAIARYATLKDIDNPKPKIITRLIDIDELQALFSQTTTLVPYNLTAGAGGSSVMPTEYNLIDISWDGLGNGSYTLTLPSAVECKYKQFRIITDGSLDNGAQDKIFITPQVGETIDGGANFEISKRYEGISIWSDGTEWIVIQAKAH